MKFSRRELFGLLAAAPIAAAAAEELVPAEFEKMRVFSVRHAIEYKWLYIEYQAAGRPKELWGMSEECFDNGPQTLPGGLQVSAGWYAGGFSVSLAVDSHPLPNYSHPRSVIPSENFLVKCDARRRVLRHVRHF